MRLTRAYVPICATQSRGFMACRPTRAGVAAHDTGRWTTLVEMEVDGCHYRLIREGQRGLTPRERDVVEQVLRGSTNKVIAYDLGIAHATVRVLLHRVMVKLGVQSRVELLRRLRPAAANESATPAATAPLPPEEMATAQEM